MFENRKDEICKFHKKSESALEKIFAEAIWSKVFNLLSRKIPITSINPAAFWTLHFGWHLREILHSRQKQKKNLNIYKNLIPRFVCLSSLAYLVGVVFLSTFTVHAVTRWLNRFTMIKTQSHFLDWVLFSINPQYFKLVYLVQILPRRECFNNSTLQLLKTVLSETKNCVNEQSVKRRYVHILCRQ